MNKPKIAFFGTDTFSTIVLDELARHDIPLELIITTPDRPQGRGLELTPSPVKIWAEAHGIPVLQPERLDDAFATTLGEGWDLFLLASYGAIIPQRVLDIPARGTLNVHPSMLPQYRGASPIESAMLDDTRDTGVTIMLMDAKMDHGPIVAQQPHTFEIWPKKPIVRDTLAQLGGALLAETIPQWLGGSITANEQDHAAATFTRKITKADGEINLQDDAYQNFLKIQAYDPWPGTYFFVEKNGKQLRIKIVDATFADGVLTITRVIPEGKKEQDFATFMQQ